jgi:non-reducing end alpha-L-arabinofuranosidase
MNKIYRQPGASPLSIQLRDRKARSWAGCTVSMLVLACSSSGQSGNETGGVGGGTVGTGGNTVTIVGSGGVAASGGKQGVGGTSATGGLWSSGGQLSSTGGAATGGSQLSSGGTQSSGGAKPTGGSAAVTGGANATGGKAPLGGASTTGGQATTGGHATTGGTSATGGNGSTGGASQSGGAPATGGSTVGGATAAGGSGVTGPCDIFATGNTPCVAAHSTVRLLLSSYGGPLYQVRRASDSKTQDIAYLASAGVADSAAQDTFCASTTCTISVIYDQSSKGNHLVRSKGGAEVCKHQDREAVADALPLKLGGHSVYAIKVVSDDNSGCTPPAGSEGTGYRLDKTTGVATGDDAETEYMVTSGETQAYQNSGCCFDYGNVETTDKDDGAATMEALYFGGGAGWGHGGGNGPWVMADMENGIFSGSTNAYTGNTSVPYPYVTAVLVGRSGGTYALMAGNAQSGNLTTMYDGARPSGYTKMKKQGAIVLGTGGDNSDHGRGYFFEGVMTTGAATAAIMNQVQANIVAAGYGQ